MFDKTYVLFHPGPVGGPGSGSTFLQAHRFEITRSLRPIAEFAAAVCVEERRFNGDGVDIICRTLLEEEIEVLYDVGTGLSGLDGA